ncbi:hypothetical protein ACEQ6A_32895 [Rhizobium brockwellii]|uniref:hypothetical protein n=1 Tax=Rhizobium brockwellii TaxID=3019932 RepID=UPI003F98E931
MAVASEEVAHNTGTAPNPDRLSISNGTSLPEWLGRVVLRKWDVVSPAAQTIIDVQIEKIQKMSKWTEASER